MTHLQVSVEEFTTPNPITASEEDPIDKLGSLMKENGIRHLPILKNNKVIGIISDRDLRVVSNLNAKQKMKIHAGDIMVKDPFTVSSDMTLADVAFEMSKNKIGSVIVNDENDQFLGIFTVTDALNALIEIVRDPEPDLSL